MLCTMLSTETGKTILLELDLVMNEYRGTQGTSSALDFWSHSICLMNLYLIFSISIHAVYLLTATLCNLYVMSHLLALNFATTTLNSGLLPQAFSLSWEGGNLSVSKLMIPVFNSGHI